MTTAIALDSASASAALSGGSSVALQDQLARCTRQLGDWVACPSSKTPEGKKIIENLRAQIGTLESRLDAKPAQGVAPAPSASRVSLSTVGSVVNAFA